MYDGMEKEGKCGGTRRSGAERGKCLCFSGVVWAGVCLFRLVDVQK